MCDVAAIWWGLEDVRKKALGDDVMCNNLALPGKGEKEWLTKTDKAVKCVPYHNIASWPGEGGEKLHYA